MVEEHGKGVALVILGIVAIIAIVGLVLLFTGARKPEGAFMADVQSVGGATYSDNGQPYSRAGQGSFIGQAYGSSGVQEGGQCYGDACKQRVVIDSAYNTADRSLVQTPSAFSCTEMARQSGLPQLTNQASVQEAQGYMQMGRQCVAVEDLVSIAAQVDPNSMGKNPGAVENAHSINAAYCCESGSV